MGAGFVDNGKDSGIPHNGGTGMADWTRRDALRGAMALAAAGALPLAAGAREKKDDRLKIVVAGAHPDDPESACGGLIALYTDAGHEVVNLYLTRGEAGIPGKSHEEAAAIRTAEAEAACRILGARPLFAGQIDGAAEITQERYGTFAELLLDEKPDLVITHWPIDTHRDHRAASLLVYDAWLLSKKRFELYYFEVESGRQTQHFQPTHYVDITRTEPRKREACMAHASQDPEGDFYPLHEEMHRFRGREAGFTRAEAYVRHTQSPASGKMP